MDFHPVTDNNPKKRGHFLGTLSCEALCLFLLFPTVAGAFGVVVNIASRLMLQYCNLARRHGVFIPGGNVTTKSAIVNNSCNVEAVIDKRAAWVASGAIDILAIVNINPCFSFVASSQMFRRSASGT